MPIVVTCPECKAKLKAPENLVGKRVKCPSCQSPVLVTEPAAVPAPAAPRPQAVAKAPVKKKVQEPVDDFEDLDDEPRPSAGRGRPARNDDFDDLDDEPRRPAAKKRSRDDDYEDDYDDEDDRPRSKKGKGGAAGGSTTEEERSNAFLFYIFLLVFWPGALIWWLMKRGDSKFVDHVGKQALNHTITIMVILMGAAFVLCGLGTVCFMTEMTMIGVIFIGLFGLLYFAICLMELILFFIAMFKVKAGEWYRYPLTWQLFK